MNSEKVKEIKKALECCVDSIKYGCEGCPYHKSSSDCQELLIWDMQTYINELESENEILHRDFVVKAYDELRAENKKLKGRITELEKKNAKLLDSVETVQSNRCVFKCVLTKEHLIKFAERLKEELKGIVDANFIDKTLKEFINE